jgi:hypothetical protein
MTTFCFHVQQYLQSGWLLENLPNHLYIFLSALEAIKGPKLPFPEMGFHSLDLQHPMALLPTSLLFEIEQMPLLNAFQF